MKFQKRFLVILLVGVFLAEGFSFVFAQESSTLPRIRRDYPSANFPTGSSYNLQFGSKSFSAEYKYAPPIPDITLYINDPVNRGGYVAAENDEGEVRMMHGLGVTGGYYCETVTGPCVIHTTGAHVLSWDAVGGGMVAQQIDEEYRSIFDATSQAVDATADGKFFLFKGRSAASSLGLIGGSQTILKFDLSEPTGSIKEPFIQSSGSLTWSGVYELKVIEVPSYKNHFLMGIGSGSTDTIRFAEISSSDGTTVKQRTFNLGTRIVPGTLSYTTLNGKTYIIARDNPGTTNAALTSMEQKVSFYEFNRSTLNLVKVGSMTLKNTPFGIISVKLAKDITGGASPILMVDVPIAGIPIVVPDNGPTLGTASDEELRFYSLKNRLTSNTSPDPDFVIPAIKENWPVEVDEIVTGQSPAQVLLKKEGAKTNLYLYRNAFLYKGERTFYDAPFEWTESTEPVTPHEAYGGGWSQSRRGVGTLRVDKIDVTSLVSGASVPTTPGISPGGTPPGGGGIGTGGECATQYPNNTSLRSLCEQIESLKAQVCKLSPTLSFCVKP